MSHHLLACIACLVVLLAGPSQAMSGTKAPDAPKPATGVQLVQSDNGFGFELFRNLLGKEPSKNIFISPTSIAMALGMTWNGAEDETRDAMAKTLGLSGLAPEDVNMANAALLATLRSADPKVQLEIANSLWARKGIPLAQDFAQTNKDYYEAEITDLDFADPKSVTTINNWVSNKTHGRIPDIIKRLEPLDVLVLINAVYFKGRWTQEFDKKLTSDRTFYLADGGTKEHPMMRRKDDFRYYAGDNFQLVSLPYGDERLSMLVLLPDRREPEEPSRDTEGNVTNVHLAKAVTDLAGQLTPENWQQWQADMTTCEGTVVLPKFKLEYEKTLNKPLSELGMGIAFDPNRADFGGVLVADIDMPVYLSEVKHKSFVEVNEEGTEAAAVTSAKMTMTAMPPPEKTFSMVCDHPFLYAIVDHKSGAVLFLGAVFEPKL